MATASTESPTVRVGIGLAIADPTAHDRVRRALEKQGATHVPLGWRDLDGAAVTAGLSGLVYDLEPWADEAAALVRRLRVREPAWPIFIYYPDEGDAVRLVPAVAVLPELWSKKQLWTNPRKDWEVEQHVRALIDRLPHTRFLRALEILLSPIPPRIAAFIERLLTRVEPGEGAGGWIDEWETETGVGSRRLEQICRARQWSAPKRLSGWVAFMYLLFRAVVRHTSFADEAARFGWHTKRRAEIRAWLLPGLPRTVRREPRVELTFAIAAFAQECRVGADRLPDAAGTLGIDIA